MAPKEHKINKKTAPGITRLITFNSRDIRNNYDHVRAT
jgi:hypothetical protein